MNLRSRLTRDEFTPKARNVARRDALRREAMAASVALIQRTTAMLTPRGVTGQTASSWEAEVKAHGALIDGAVGSPLAWSAALEGGRLAGSMPPVEALEAWVSAKLGDDVDAFVVARAIGRRGTQPQEMLRQAIDLTRSAREAIWSNLAREGLVLS